MKKILGTFWVRCIKEYPEDHYISYTLNCTYFCKHTIDDNGKEYWWIDDDYLGGIGWGLNKEDYKEHFKYLHK